MNQLHQSFQQFINKIHSQLSPIGIKLTNYPIDHICFRVANHQDYQTHLPKFTQLSKLHLQRIFHQRQFHLFILSNPFEYQNQSIPYLEFSQPGGSDNYRTGFQHIELLTNQKLTQMIPDQNNHQNLIFTNQQADEQYLKWPDKTAVKLTPMPLITKMLIANNLEIDIP